MCCCCIMSCCCACHCTSAGFTLPIAIPGGKWLWLPPCIMVAIAGCCSGCCGGGTWCGCC
ncbi:hypothetical protein BC828DRAFT_386516 [Blastocladiella britannica]|nr:hypothetical protein BC828DRAFT_386516 [Blastocladiella britannica]